MISPEKGASTDMGTKGLSFRWLISVMVGVGYGYRVRLEYEGNPTTAEVREGLEGKSKN